MLETSTLTSETVRALQRKLYRKAQAPPTFRFYTLYDKVYRSDVLQRAYDLVKHNKGIPGIDGETFEAIEAGMGWVAYLQGDTGNAKSKHLPSHARKTGRDTQTERGNPNVRYRIRCIKDRIVQMSTKLVIEPIFEADFSPHSYGFRPKQSAHQAWPVIWPYPGYEAPGFCGKFPG